MGAGIKKYEKMTQDERWIAKYNEVVEFINTNHRNPSRHRIEEHDMLNWLKATRKRMNAGELKAERLEMFKKLLVLVEENKHLNQYI
jgi:hypothetical protein